jgi:ABC-type transporter Mla subunit MlaD
MIRTVLLSTLTALIIIGCGNTTHDFKIRFSDIQGLRKGDHVLFEDTVIGDVKDVVYTDSGEYLASVSVKKQFTSRATDASRFYIDSESESGDRKAIRVIQIKEGGNVIEEGAIVEGQSKYAVMYEQFADQFRKNIDMLESELNEFLKGLKDLSENEQIKQIEMQLDRILAELGNLSLEMKNKLQTEILPLIREQIEELRRRLEKTGQEGKLKYVDQKIEMISAKLKV